MNFQVIGPVDIALVLQYLVTEIIQLISYRRGWGKNTADNARRIKKKIKIEFLRRHFIKLKSHSGSARRLGFAELDLIFIAISFRVHQRKEWRPHDIVIFRIAVRKYICLLYTSPSPRD